MEVKVFSCTECSRIVQAHDTEKGNANEHRCPRHPSAPMIFHGNIYYTILVASRG